MSEYKKSRLPRGITQRRDGLYMGRFQYEGEIYPPVYGRTIRETERKLNELKYEVTHQAYTPKSRVTMDEWFKTWLNEYRGIRIKEGTKETYRNTYNARIHPVLGDKRLTSVRVEHIQKLYNKMADEGYSRGLIKLTEVVLMGMFKQAVKNGIVGKNPVEATTLPLAKSPKARVALTKDEQNAFMRYARETSPDYRFYLLILATGMRNGEARALEWKDVDFENRLIHITGTLKYIKGKGHFKDTPKTKSSFRDIPMTDICFDLLKEQREIQNEMMEAACEYWNPMEGLRDIVFTTNDGKAYTKEHVEHELKRIINIMTEDGVSIPNFTIHTLRHTFATRGLEQDISLRAMQAILGHKNLAMTSDLYVHVLPDTKAAEMKKMDEIFYPKGKTNMNRE